MANVKNLVKGDEIHKFTPEEHSKGGKRSAEVRREKKELKKIIEALFEKDYTMLDGKKTITLSGAEAIAFKQMEKALKGDTKAFEVLRDTAGQKPVDKVEQVNIDAEYKSRVNELRGYFERDNTDDTKQS